MLYYINLVASSITSVILLFTAFFVLVKNRGGQSPLYYFYYNLAGFGIVFSMFLVYILHDSQYLIYISKMVQISSIIWAGSMLNLSLTYPEKEKKVPYYIPLACISPAIIISILIFFTDLSIKSVKFENMRQIRETGFLYYIFAIVTFSYFLICMGIFIYNYITVKIDAYRLQIRYLIFATSFFILFTYVTSVAMPMFAKNYSLYAIGPSSVGAVATITLFYSIIAYNLMDIRTAIIKAMTYLLLTAVFFTPVVTIFFLFEGRLRNFNIPAEITAASTAVVFIMFTYFLQPRIDRTYRRNITDIKELTNNYLRKAAKFKTLEELIEKSTLELYKGLSLTRAIFFIYDDDVRIFRKTFDTSKASDNDDPVIERHFPLIKWFARNQEILPENRVYIDEDSFSAVRDSVTGFFNMYGIGTILPLYYENRISGMLCLGKKDNGKNLTPDEIENLEEFRQRLNDLIITVLAYDKAKKDQFITRSLELSSDILERSAAGILPGIKNIRFGSLVAPRYSRGFDYFDFLQPTANTLGVLCTDVSGIGINNSLYSVILRSVFHACVNEAASPYVIIKRINLVINEYTRGRGELVTAFYAFLDSDSRRIYYANAGFPPMEVFRIDKNDFDSLDTEGSPLGYDPLSEYGQGTSELKAGDICILYSKSLINSKNSDGENFGLLRLRNTVKELKMRNPADIVQHLKTVYENFMGISLPTSDITVLIMKIV